ncbi:hypothetical protein Tco_0058695 [Tanacetum coccineum]
MLGAQVELIIALLFDIQWGEGGLPSWLLSVYKVGERVMVFVGLLQVWRDFGDGEQWWGFEFGGKQRYKRDRGDVLGLGKKAVMSSASSAVTYTSVHTDSEPGRAFWGADEEISDGGSPRVIVYGYDGLPMQPVAPPSPDYIPGPEDPQTPPVPQDEDEREPMFVQAHDPDYVPEPVYPEYIPLEDEHVFPAEEQPLPPVDSPTAESPGYITESDPEEDPEEYEDDETEDGPVDYPMDGGDDGDDDDDNSSRDDVDEEDEDDEDDEDEEGLFSHLREQSLLYHHPPLTLPLELRLPSGPRLPYPFHQRQRIASTRALIDAVTVALPPPPLPPLPPSPYIPPHVDRSRYEIGESSTAGPTRGRGIDYGFVSMVDAEERRQGIRDVGYGIMDTWVDPTEAATTKTKIKLTEYSQFNALLHQCTPRTRFSECRGTPDSYKQRSLEKTDSKEAARTRPPRWLEKSSERVIRDMRERWLPTCRLSSGYH